MTSGTVDQVCTKSEFTQEVAASLVMTYELCIHQHVINFEMSRCCNFLNIVNCVTIRSQDIDVPDEDFIRIY
jgi:hypothetical protein